MVKIVFYDWIIGMRPIPFYKMLSEKANISLKEAQKIRLKIGAKEIVEVEVENESLANEIIVKSLEYGVLAKMDV